MMHWRVDVQHGGKVQVQVKGSDVVDGQSLLLRDGVGFRNRRRWKCSQFLLLANSPSLSLT